MDLMCLTAAASTLSGWRAGEPAGDVPAHVKVAGHQADPDAVQQNEGEQRGEVNLWSQQQAQGGGKAVWVVHVLWVVSGSLKGTAERLCIW